jgi:pyridoxine kinase
LRAQGEVLAGEQLWALIEGLEVNKLLCKYTHALTGYIGSASFGTTTINTIKKLREENPGFVYVCDPVMGDNGKMYVPTEMVQLFRDELVPLATGTNKHTPSVLSLFAPLFFTC